MTEQSCEDLKNEHPELDLGKWRVYGVIRGVPNDENHGWGTRERAYRTDPGEVEMVRTSNWKGYHEAWKLRADGRLVLDRIEFDEYGREPLVANEVVEGDLFLVLKSTFESPRVYIPFESGVIVLDRSRWLHEAYVAPSPSNRTTEIRPGAHPDFPNAARLWYE